MLYVFLAIILLVIGSVNFILALLAFDDINKRVGWNTIFAMCCLIMCGFNIARFFYGV